MALNLWKIGGQPTSYNPLPPNLNNFVSLGIGNYVLTLNAKSAGSSVLRLGGSNSQLTTNGQVTLLTTLTPASKLYTFNVSVSSKQSFFIVDDANKGDIIIDSISLVQKPLSKLTINGVDGFLSGKWTLNANATVVDDQTLVLNASAGFQNNTLDVSVIGNQLYQLACNITGDSSGYIDITWKDSTGATISTSSRMGTGTNLMSVTTPSNAVKGTFNFCSTASGTFTFKRPILNLGSIPAPYEPKSGDRMVLPVARKNLSPSFDVVLQSSGISYSTINVNGRNFVQFNAIVKTLFTGFKPNTVYTMSFTAYQSGTGNPRFVADYTDGTQVSIPNSTYPTTPTKMTFTTDSTKSLKDIALNFGNTNSMYVALDDFQIEQGNTATPFVPYATMPNKQPARTNANGQPAVLASRKGLAFNGVTDYLQLPSMTMDSIELDWSIDSNQPNSGAYSYIDARTGLANGYMVNNGVGGLGSGWTTFKVNGVNGTSPDASIPKGQRCTVFLGASSFTDDVVILANYTGGAKTKGILYKVTCYLAGNVVAKYDFTNPQNIVGTTVIPSAQNLIPSFEDPRWTINANAKIMGRDCLHLDATALNQTSRININVQSNKTYLFNCFGNSNTEHFYIDEYDINNNKLRTTGNPMSSGVYNVSFTTLSSTAYIVINLANDNSGSFDYIKPQLFMLTGAEGTINGNPVQQNKGSKRTLYAKR